MRFRFLWRDRDEVIPGSTSVARTLRRHKYMDGVRRNLGKRVDEEKSCEISGDEEEDKKDKKDKKDKDNSASSVPKIKSKCSRSTPTPSGAAIQPPPLPLIPQTTSLIDGTLGSIPILSVSAFPVMATGTLTSAGIFLATTTTGVSIATTTTGIFIATTTTGISIATTTTESSIIATATTLILNAPAVTPSSALPSGTRKTGNPSQDIQASTHPKLSPHAKNALIAFGVIMGIALIGFLIFTAYRFSKRKRIETSAYGDLEERLYSNERTATPEPESETIAMPPEAHVVQSPPSQKYYLPPIFRTSQRPWSGCSWGRSEASQTMEGDPFADGTFDEDPRRDLFPPPVVLEKAVLRKEVGTGREDPFRDPEIEMKEDQEDVERMGESTMRGFKSKPSWVNDQAVRIGMAR